MTDNEADTMSNIDDLLHPRSTPPSPENEAVDPLAMAEDDIEAEEPEADIETDLEPESGESVEEESKSARSVDAYGNEIDNSESEPVYTKAQLEAIMRERLERQARSIDQRYQQELQQRQQSVAKDESVADEDWEKHLLNLVDNAVSAREQKAAQQRQMQAEQALQQAYEMKLVSGAQRFKDFDAVIANVPITEAMLRAGASFDDPSAFYYAAAKSMPKELHRISQIADPYAQVAEIGRLEAKLRSNAGNNKMSKTPKPIGKVATDSVKAEKPKKPSIDDLLAQEDAKRWSRRQSSPIGRRR